MVQRPPMAWPPYALQHLAQATRDLATVYHAASRLAASDEIEAFWRHVRGAAPGAPSISPSNWSECFDALVDLAIDQPLLVALDEVPYLVESTPSFPASLQRAWDRARHLDRPCHLHLVLTGSALSTMNDLVSSSGALYERPDLRIRLDPFDVSTSASFLGDPPAAAAIEAWAATGGYPLLLERWDPAAKASTNLVRLAGDPVGALATNASVLLLDLPESHSYERVLSAVGRGASRMSEITNHAGQRVERTLKVLEATGYIDHVAPLGEARRAAGRYHVADQYLRFWFAVVERDLQLIEGGQGRAVIARALPRWERHLGASFETLARGHLAQLASRGAVDETLLVGRWWTDRPAQVELDVLATDDRGWSIVGEVKWSKEFSFTDLQRFLGLLRAVGDRATRARLALWARDSFPPAVVEATRGSLRFTASDVVAGAGP